MKEPEKKKSMYFIIWFIKNSRKIKKLYCNRKQFNGCQGAKEEITKLCKETLGWYVLDYDNGSTVYTHVTSHQIVYFKHMQFIINQLYLNKGE